jgi:hypothetical protein
VTDARDRLRLSPLKSGWFWAWAAVGLAAAAGFISLGPLLLIPAALAGAFLALPTASRRGAGGLLLGVGVLSLSVAWMQRRGPGVVAWHTATASGSEQYLDPRPWLAVGAALVVLGILAQLWLNHRHA